MSALPLPDKDNPLPVQLPPDTSHQEKFLLNYRPMDRSNKMIIPWTTGHGQVPPDNSRQYLLIIIDLDPSLAIRESSTILGGNILRLSCLFSSIHILDLVCYIHPKIITAQSLSVISGKIFIFFFRKIFSKQFVWLLVLHGRLSRKKFVAEFISSKLQACNL